MNKIIRFHDYRNDVAPFKLEPCKNALKRAAHLSDGQVNWKAVDSATRSAEAEKHHWPGSAKMAHLLALVTGKGQ